MTQTQKLIKYFALAFAFLIIVNIFGGIFYFIYSFSDIFDEDEPKNMEYLDIESSEVTYLDIDLSYTKLTIKPGDQFLVETNSDRINYHKDNNRLTIKEKKRNFFSKRSNTELIIYVPSDLVFDKVEVETGAGVVNIDSMATKVFKFDIGAGKVYIHNLNVIEKTSIDGGAGELTIDGSNLNDLDLDMGVGKTTVSAILNGFSDIDAGVGELNINILEKLENYKLKIDKGIGTIKVNNEEVNSNTFGNGNNLIEIDGGVGSITITSNE